jgi:pimeloyl-ACP methyl ester carboxylesterase
LGLHICPDRHQKRAKSKLVKRAKTTMLLPVYKGVRPMVKWLLRILLLLAVALVGAFLLARTPDGDAEALIAQYGGSQARFVDSPSGRIHYRVSGPEGAPALLLIHGSNSALLTWEGVRGALEDRYRIVALDLPGHGLTGPNPKRDYRADAMLAAIPPVLDAAGIDKAIWVGNSMGGWLTWRGALAMPERVAGIVLIDASGYTEGEKVTPYLGARLASSWLGRQILPHVTPKSLVQSSLVENYAKPERLKPAMVDYYYDMLHFPGNRAASVLRQQTDREPQFWARIGGISVPTLVLWGEQDSVIPVSHADGFVAAIKGAKKVTYADAGHLPMEEIPRRVARDIDEWAVASGLAKPVDAR